MTVRHADCDLTGVLITYRNYGGAHVPKVSGTIGTSSGFTLTVDPGSGDVTVNARGPECPRSPVPPKVGVTGLVRVHATHRPGGYYYEVNFKGVRWGSTALTAAAPDHFPKVGRATVIPEVPGLPVGLRVVAPHRRPLVLRYVIEHACA